MSFGFGKGRWLAKMVRQGKAGQGRKMRGGGRCGPSTNCICPQCGLIVPRDPGIPCYQRKCPQCGSFMARQFLETD